LQNATKFQFCDFRFIVLGIVIFDHYCGFVKMRYTLFFVECLLVLCGVYGEEMLISMPPLEVHSNDAYLCTPTKLPSKPTKLTSIEPRADQKVVHHMLLFGNLGSSQ